MDANKLLSQSEQDQFLDAANAAYAALKNDPVAWQEELEERALWDRTLGDGIEILT